MHGGREKTRGAQEALPVSRMSSARGVVQAGGGCSYRKDCPALLAAANLAVGEELPLWGLTLWSGHFPKARPFPVGEGLRLLPPPSLSQPPGQRQRKEESSPFDNHPPPPAPRRGLETCVPGGSTSCASPRPPSPRRGILLFLSSTVHGAFSLFAKERMGGANAPARKGLNPTGDDSNDLF